MEQVGDCAGSGRPGRTAVSQSPFRNGIGCEVLPKNRTGMIALNILEEMHVQKQELFTDF